MLLVRSSLDGTAQNQIEALRAFAMRSGYEVAAEMSLCGASSSDPAMDSALEKIMDRKDGLGGVTRLLITDLAVLTRRGPAHGLWLIQALASAGIKLVVLNDLSADNPADTFRRLMTLMIAAKSFCETCDDEAE